MVAYGRFSYLREVELEAPSEAGASTVEPYAQQAYVFQAQLRSISELHTTSFPMVLIHMQMKSNFPMKKLQEHGWRSGDCTRLTPNWLGFDLGVVVMSGLSYLLVPYSAPIGFSPGSPDFTPPQKSTFPNSNSIGCRIALKTTFK